LGSTIFLSLIIGDVNAIGAVIISNADNLKGLSYSRSLEKEADENGLQILKERGMDCNGFVRLFQILKKENEVNVNEWISSHPDLNKRIDYIKNSDECKQNNFITNNTLHSLFLQLKTAE
jgi:predicted Zn-dependent protease